MINYKQNELFNYEESKKAFYEELYKANYNYDKDAIEKNYELWAERKENVYNFLRQHKDWREDLMAIDTTIDVVRAVGDVRSFLQNVLCKIKTAHQWEINNPSGRKTLYFIVDFLISQNYTDETYNEFSHKITQLSCDKMAQQLSRLKEQSIEFYNELQRIAKENDNQKDYELIKYLMQRYGENCNIYFWYFGEYRQLHKGQPISRFLIKLIENLNLKDGIFNMYDFRSQKEFINGTKFYKADGTWLIDYYFSQNQITTILSDLCKEKTISKRFIISINPMDYLTQSHGKGDFNSCHTLRGHGCYHGGIISMMTDPSTVIVYEVDNDLTFNCQNQRDFFNNKIQRQLMFISDDIESGFFQSVYYPSKDNASTLAITNKMKQLYKQVYNEDLTTEQDTRAIKPNMVDNTYYLSYEDWFCGKVMTLSKGENTPHFTIGGTWWTASNVLAPERENVNENDNLDISNNHDGKVWCVDIEEWRNQDDCFYAVDDGDYYYDDNDLYYTEDTNEWYADCCDLYFAENSGKWYRHNYDLYWVEDLECYYDDWDDLYYTEDTGRYFSTDNDLYQCIDTGNYYENDDDLYFAEDTDNYFESCQSLYQDYEGYYYEFEENVPQNDEVDV